MQDVQKGRSGSVWKVKKKKRGIASARREPPSGLLKTSCSARVDKDLHTDVGAHSVTQVLLCLIDSSSARFRPITTPDIRYDNIVSQKADGESFSPRLLSGFCRSYSKEETVP